MSGHSKWANIKNKKGKADAQRGKIFTKIGREIAIAVREGGSDPDSNSKLKDVISKAKANNMPNDNITRSIKKAAGDVDQSNYEEIVYEGYGPSGVAVIVEATTDNRNRTAGEVRHLFDKSGGNLGTLGSVTFMFDKKGIIVIENDGSKEEDSVMMDALDSGADDFDADEDFFEVTTSPESFRDVRDALEEKGYTFVSAGVEMVPKTETKLADEEQREAMEKLIDGLEDNEDVMNVYHNWDNEE